MTGGLATWLYAVTAEPCPADLSGVTGVAGEAVRLVRSDGLAAVVGSVPLGDFDEEPLTAHLEDLAWLERAARAHDRVISAAARSCCVVPLRFATVYRDDARVRGLLRDRRADFAATLRRLADRTEWGVKGYVDPEALSEQAPQSPPSPDAAGGGRPGTAYLLRRKAQQVGRQSAQERAVRYAEEIHAALCEQAAASARHRPQDPRLAAYQGWMILNSSFLVADERTADFTAAVDALRQRFPAVRLEVSGPWPGYSFTGEAGAGGDAAPVPGAESGPARRPE